MKYKIPTRGLLGLRNAILTASRGTAILNTIFDSYGPWAGDISTRDNGSLVKFQAKSIILYFSIYCTCSADLIENKFPGCI